MGGVDDGEEGREVGIGDEERPEEKRERCEGKEEETMREIRNESTGSRRQVPVRVVPALGKQVAGEDERGRERERERESEKARKRQVGSGSGTGSGSGSQATEKRKAWKGAR